MAINFDSISNFFLPSALTKLASNFTKAKDEFSKVLYRDGSSQMLANLDMNGRRIINHSDPVADGDLATLGVVKQLASSIPKGAKGDTGAANSTYATLTELKAANPSNLSYILTTPTGPVTYSYVNGNYTGQADDLAVVKLDAVPLTTGALVRQNADSILFASNTLKERLSNEVWVTDYIPRSVWNNIKANGNVDASPYVQAAIDDVWSRGGGVIRYPAMQQSSYKMNVINRHQVSHVGATRGGTIWTPFSDAPVLRTPTDASCNNWRVENLTIYGNTAFTNQDGIRLETSGTGNFIDTVRLINLDIRNCGRWGVYARGTSSSGPFVQRLYIDDCEIGFNWRNLALLGCVIEVSVHQSSLCQTQDTASNAMSILIDFAGESIPGRITFTGGTIMSNPGKACMAIGGVETLLVQGCGIEFSNPGIRIIDFALIRNVKIDCNSFQSISPSQNQIWVSQCKGLTITNNVFSAGSTITDAIYLDGSGAGIPWPILEGNIASGTGVTNLITDPSGYLAPLVNGTVNANRSLMSLTGSGDLTTILDQRGTLNTFVRGDTKVMILSNGGAITVKHGTGNLFLRDGADYALGTGKSITFTYVGGGWFESGRS